MSTHEQDGAEEGKTKPSVDDLQGSTATSDDAVEGAPSAGGSPDSSVGLGGESTPTTPEEPEPDATRPEEKADLGSSSGDADQTQKKQKKKGMRSGEKRSARSGTGLTPLGFSLRFAAAILLVFGTYNPSGNSYYHWIASWESTDLPAKILLGLLVLAGWVVFFRATSRSLGPVGAVLAAAVCGVALWWLIDLNVVAQSTNAITYAILFIVSAILTLGLTGSFVWRRLTGQYQVDADDGSMDD